jgi:hypothetical protein
VEKKRLHRAINDPQDEPASAEERAAVAEMFKQFKKGKFGSTDT